MIAVHQSRNGLARKAKTIAVLVIGFMLGASQANAQVPAGTAPAASSAEPACQVSAYPGLAALSASKDSGSAAELGLPAECGLGTRENQREVHHGQWATPLSHWEDFFCGSMRVCHNPLYFEDRALERYGCRKCLQPVRSTTRFAAQAILLPIQKWHLPKRTCLSSPCATR